MADKIKEPHAHDVLSGRGNFVNYHDGNEYFRKLVRKHKLEYVNCPKQQKGKFSKLIVDEIKARNPPGRFLKQDKDTKLWYDIGEKKALDKTRQALREGAPELMHNGKGTSPKDETGGDTAFNKEIGDQSHLSTSDFSLLHRSLISMGNDSLNVSGMMQSYDMGGMGLSPNMFNNSNNNNKRLGNQAGGVDFSQVIPPPQLHQNESDLLQQQQRKEQELTMRYLQRQQLEQQRQQQHQDRQSRQNQFTSQEEQEILRNATAVMGNDFPRQPTNMHMDQLRINRLKEKRKMLEQQILHQRQLEILELKKLQNQQKLNEYQQQQNDQNNTQPLTTSSEMRGALQSRLGAVYGGTEAMLEPTPMSGQNQVMPPPSFQSNGGSNNLDVTAELQDNTSAPRDRRSGLVRENSLKMESVFENSGGGSGGGGGGNTAPSNPKRNFNMSASGMSMSATSLSLGFDEEGELSALFDTSMKLTGDQARGYATTLNDNPPRSPKPLRGRKNSAGLNGSMGGSKAFMEMSLASTGFEKSNSSMSCDSSLSRLFDDSGGK
mmetsp:Transcript_16668/g.38472  ORF Transcript_16668/g.38472 Transcript_16668/m.38472 type:complete len:547 (-) Transcript_16668:236-1876(-)|eukprot:CAMPEP_0197176594 /NCGR_PEP_ID=MMETSP1423-20130617/2464_1 /TAXON_ID=476441 /ORGANISM="Pseudo-nitzschia heimii, Strain UNC1101" /LENGTH=546 /DNA_ID=CAMNT_0042625987 /DNA_START=56 /DNA_END=1696 /DNA_ORIENTATION=-